MESDPNKAIPAEAEVEAEKGEETKKRDIRRYACEYCGIVRSKRALITSHILSEHQEEAAAQVDREEEEREKMEEERKRCKECGVWFKKPAHLKQHMLSHSSEKPFSCPIEDCKSSYGRKDHLNRHLLSHQGKAFCCPVESCSSKFVIKGNLNRHVKEFHECPDRRQQKQKEFVCQEVGCGKTFRFASKLATHEESHVKLDCCEVICMEVGCMKHFSNADCLKEHMISCHSCITCVICGKKQLKKNMKRHQRTHEEGTASPEIKCSFDECKATFSNKSNLKKHVMAVHEDSRPFVCSFPGCGKRFAYRHVRDNHEKTAVHLNCHGDFEEADEEFQSGERGGRKRKNLSVDMLLRKRVAMSPDSSHAQNPDASLENPTEYLGWLLSGS
ncbi:Transcription factor IIIA [Rhynchospora pubera]|uniref:Transcription factor IIIA n=1 Tax=Rhynchospora pubera TaxID=906938 RepID=A0AAV8HWC8_9POAL|nr:Transcription factor IIIA [Rhynchospora pubera]